MNYFAPRILYPKPYFFNKNSGFTLMELLVVIIILAIMACLTIPNLNQLLKKIRNPSEVNKVVSLLKYARHQAVIEGVKYRVACELSNKSFWLDKGSQNNEDFIRIMNKTLSLSDSTKVMSQIDAFVFYPLGNSSGGEIMIDEYWITVDKITGRVIMEKRNE